MVFLAGGHAYKVKKPVRLPFVDFSTLARRRHFCHEEVRLNRRLAGRVYHGVVPIVGGDNGARVLDVVLDDPSQEPPSSEGQVLEWAVRMDRLPADRTLESLLRRGELAGDEALRFFDRLARRLADFHQHAERSDEISRTGGLGTVAANARDNLTELEPAVGQTVSAPVLERLRHLTEEALTRLRPLIERRAAEGRPCDGHGDLRLGHVYQLPSPSGDDELAIIDCIEFNEKFRFADPVADMAFLAMELDFEDRPELRDAFTRSYLEAAGDPEGEDLLPFYVAYRGVVRGKIRTLTARDPGIGRDEQEKAAARATRHLLRALGWLAPPDERPSLVLLAGLPGTGKSALAQALTGEGGFTWIDTDRVRKELARKHDAGTGTDGDGAAGNATGFEEGIYTPEWTERTYGECLRQATALLFDGSRVLVEGAFRTERHRRLFVDDARALGVPALVLIIEAERDVVRRRLEDRTRAEAAPDASDADWDVYRQAERRWEEPGTELAPVVRRIRGDAPLSRVVDQARAVLDAAGLTA